MAESSKYKAHGFERAIKLRAVACDVSIAQMADRLGVTRQAMANRAERLPSRATIETFAWLLCVPPWLLVTNDLAAIGAYPIPARSGWFDRAVEAVKEGRPWDPSSQAELFSVNPTAQHYAATVFGGAND